MKHIKSSVFNQYVQLFCCTMFAIFICAGCDSSGSDGDNTSPPADKVKEGVFVDSPVEGLNYETPTQSGTTDANGRFMYIDGETVMFSIGSTMMGSGPGQEIMTPGHLVNGANDITHPTVTNMGRFLQSLDADGDPENGITISAEISNYMADRHINFTQTMMDFENDPEVTGLFDTLNTMGMFSDGNQWLCPVNQAWDHMYEHMGSEWSHGYIPGWNDNTDVVTSLPGSTLYSEAVADGAALNSPDWDQVQGITVSVMPMMEPAMMGRWNTVELKSVHDSANVYIFARWRDADESIYKKMWQKSGNGWGQIRDDEDRLAFAWDIDGSVSYYNYGGNMMGNNSYGMGGMMNGNVMGGSMMGGCATLCHINPDQPNKRIMAAAYSGDIVDIWHWKSARSNPVGFADDQYLDVEERKNDAGTGSYADNISDDGLYPFYMNAAGPSADPFLFEDGKILFDDQAFITDDTIPAFVLKTPSGDRGDVQAEGKWENGYWTVILTRSLSTDSPHDVRFLKGASHGFAISVFDNAGDEFHLKSGLLNLVLQ